MGQEKVEHTACVKHNHTARARGVVVWPPSLATTTARARAGGATQSAERPTYRKGAQRAAAGCWGSHVGSRRVPRAPECCRVVKCCVVPGFARTFPCPTHPRTHRATCHVPRYNGAQSGNSGVFGLSALSQENDLIFARKREKIFLGTFSAKTSVFAQPARRLSAI